MSESTTRQDPAETPADRESYEAYELGQQVTIEDIDGALVNEATGEILGYKDAAFALPPADNQTLAGFSAEQLATYRAEREKALREAVLWATERRARANAALEARKFEMNALIAGVKERFEGLVLDQQRRIDWIDRVYGPAMKEFTKSQLEGGGPKSMKLPWATLGFRSSKGKLEVSDPIKAAYTLGENGLSSAIEVTLDLEALIAEQDTANFEHLAADLLTATSEAFAPEWVYEGDDPKLISVNVPRGVTFSIKANKIPAEIPDDIEGLERKISADPLGEFYVKH